MSVNPRMLLLYQNRDLPKQIFRRSNPVLRTHEKTPRFGVFFMHARDWNDIRTILTENKMCTTINVSWDILREDHETN